jgi:hypothetical protein
MFGLELAKESALLLHSVLAMVMVLQRHLALRWHWQLLLQPLRLASKPVFPWT